MAKLLLSEPDIDDFFAFFDEAKSYLDIAGHGQDTSQDWHISCLAVACADHFSIESEKPNNPLTHFALKILEQDEPSNFLAWHFVARMCERYLLDSKNAKEKCIENALLVLLDATKAKSRLLKDIYINIHPSSTGPLTESELACILAYENDYSGRELFYILGAFYATDPNKVHQRLEDCLEASMGQLEEASNSMASFISSSYITALRYEWDPAWIPFTWIIKMITNYALDGMLLGMHQLESMRRQAGIHLNMVQLTELIRSRCDLEQNAKPYPGFEFLPHKFPIGDWVAFDETQLTELIAFEKFCHVALGRTFIAIYWMPKFLCEIDPSGKHVANFVANFLTKSPTPTGKELARLASVASGYENDSSGWTSIAGHICERAMSLTRSERVEIYFALSRKETDVMISMPGQVPDYYVRAFEKATRLRDAEPLDSPLRDYREWALKRAQAEFREQQEWAEEFADE